VGVVVGGGGGDRGGDSGGGGGGEWLQRHLGVVASTVVVGVGNEHWW
jgi:hypothetical protein